MTRWWIPALMSIAVVAPGAGAANRPAAPQPAPAFTLPAAQGTVSLDSLRGHVVLVDFWASWCGPCRESFPWMAALSKRDAARGLTVVAISVDKDRPAAQAFIDHFAPPFTVAFDPAGRTAQAFQVKGMPSTYLIDAQGRIIYSHVGFDAGRAKALEAAVDKALATVVSS